MGTDPLIEGRGTDSLVISSRVFTSCVATTCLSASFYLVGLMSYVQSTAGVQVINEA